MCAAGEAAGGVFGNGKGGCFGWRFRSVLVLERGKEQHLMSAIHGLQGCMCKAEAEFVRRG
jgi:hypothetical protein